MNIKVKLSKHPGRPDNSIIVDGVDISRYVSGIFIRGSVNEITSVDLRLVGVDVEIDADAEVSALVHRLEAEEPMLTLEEAKSSFDAVAEIAEATKWQKK